MRRRTLSIIALALAGLTIMTDANAQLSKNPDKFLGNITTYGQVNYQGREFKSLWNQITCENETKWQSVQGSGQNSWNWNDAAYNYARNNNILFKFHTLVWGSQYPSWMNNLSTANQYKAIVKWFDETKKHYPDLEMIDVVNEAIAGHAPAPFKDALGGDGKTGYDWIIKAFEMAYERWPNAILIYNDYNTFQYNTSQFIDLVKTLRDAGAPIDAYGCQSHDLTDMSFDNFKSVMTEIQKELKMPMYSTEYDIGTTDDSKQAQQYKDQIKYMWESDYCAGITLWGYIYGATWINQTNSNGDVVERGISGIIKNGNDRPAMTWLREYMATDAAKNAQSPFPGMKKEASVYVKPKALKLSQNENAPINVRARMRTKKIETILLRVKAPKAARWKVIGDTIKNPTATSFDFDYKPDKVGVYQLKAIVTTTDGTRYERDSYFTVVPPRSTFKSMELPGTVQAEDFDVCAEGVSYHDSNSDKEGDAASYRSDCDGIDVVKGNGGYALGYTNQGEWMEYTVNVKSAGTYDFVATASSGTTNSGFRIGLMKDGVETQLATVSVPQTADNSWGTYTTISGTLSKGLGTGPHTLRITITGSNCNIDKIEFTFKSDVKYITQDDDFLNGQRYNLGGQRVNQYKNGNINIINGKKVLIIE
jgi:GH35 family endo-1,4-beta-xylanase